MPAQPLACAANVLDGTIAGAFNAFYGNGNNASATGLALDLRFADTKTLDPRITFTRASSGTFVNSSGLVESATTNTPRFTHLASTLASLGLLIEEARTNFALNSQTFSSWTNVNTTESAAALSPLSTGNAWKIEETSATGFHDIQTSVSGGFVGGTMYAASCYLAPSERTTCQIILLRGSDFCILSVNLSTLSAVSGGVSNFTAPANIMVGQAANGYYRVSFTTTPTNTGTGIASIRLQSGSYAGTTGSGIFATGMQVEPGSSVSSYIPTAGVSATRAADVADDSAFTWLNQDQGTFVVEGISSRNFAASPVAIGDSSLRAPLGFSTGGAGNSWNAVTSVTTANTVATNTAYKMALAYDASGRALCLNAGTVATSTQLQGAFTGVQFGRLSTSQYINAPIARFRAYRRSLRGMLQSLTT